MYVNQYLYIDKDTDVDVFISSSGCINLTLESATEVISIASLLHKNSGCELERSIASLKSLGSGGRGESRGTTLSSCGRAAPHKWLRSVTGNATNCYREAKRESDMLPLTAAMSFEHRGSQCLLTLTRSTSPPPPPPPPPSPPVPPPTLPPPTPPPPPLDQFPVRVCSCPLCIVNRL